MLKKILFIFISGFILLYFWNVFAAGSLLSPWFNVNVGWIFPSWTAILAWSWEETAKNLVETIAVKLLMWIWFFALLIMIIWGGFMVVANWKDELLTKWKWIFMAWLIWLIIALSASWIMKLVIYIIY